MIEAFNASDAEALYLDHGRTNGRKAPRGKDGFCISKNGISCRLCNAERKLVHLGFKRVRMNRRIDPLDARSKGPSILAPYAPWTSSANSLAEITGLILGSALRENVSRKRRPNGKSPGQSRTRSAAKGSPSGSRSASKDQGVRGRARQSRKSGR